MFIRRALNFKTSHMSGYLRLETEIFSCVFLYTRKVFIFISLSVMQNNCTWPKNKTMAPPKSQLILCFLPFIFHLLE